MLANFLLGNLKYIIPGVLILLGFLYFQYTQNVIQNLKNNNVLLENSVEKQQETINQINSDFSKYKEINETINDNRIKNEKQVQDLYKKFNKSGRNFEELLRKKPQLLENIINRASGEMIECYEYHTGKSNTSCDQ